MLTELKEAHDELLAQIDALEALVRAPAPDRVALGNVRWKLSRASSNRRRLVDAACDQLLARLGPEEARAVRDLRESGGEARLVSTSHVGRWPLEEVLANWRGYQQDSAVIRNDMRKQVAREKAVLYPLLEGR